MREKAFENKVKKYLKDRGAWVLKTWSNGVQRSGIPDLLVCWRGYFMGIELKAENGRPSPLQLYEIDEIGKAGGFAIVLYPSGFEEFQLMLETLDSVLIDDPDQHFDWEHIKTTVRGYYKSKEERSIWK